MRPTGHTRERLRAQLPALGVAALAGVTGVAASYAVAGFAAAFVAVPIAGVLARVMPGQVVTFAILVLGDLGHLLTLWTAIALAVALLGAVGLAGLVAGRRRSSPVLGVALGGAGAAALASLLTAIGGPTAGMAALGSAAAAGVGVAAVLTVAALAASVERPRETSADRRRVLGGLAGALGLTTAGAVLGRRGGLLGEPPGAGDPLDVDPATRGQIRGQLDRAADAGFGIDGIEPLVSEDFYTVDINAVAPAIDADTWTLSVTGAVDEELEYGYDDLRSRPPENRFVTLRCVGESLNGHKMDTALWTGVPVMDLVEPAGPAEECCVMLRAADGFYEEFPLSALADGFLAYGMNGRTLPGAHGYPVRALIPGHWGEINVKWLTEIEVLETERKGYWEKRGWHGTGPVETVAKLHHVGTSSDGRREVAGHAYAGTRGISEVEVSVDGGTTWTTAALTDPLPGQDVWRQWRHRYEPPGGAHEVVVRATDGEGRLQPETESNAFPSGPTGWVSRTVGQ